MWALPILGAAIAIPIVIELTCDPIFRQSREQATDQFAQRSQGTTHCEWFAPSSGHIVICVHGLTTRSFVWGGLFKS